MQQVSSYQIEAAPLPIKEFLFSSFSFLVCCVLAPLIHFYPLVLIGLGLSLVQFAMEITARAVRDNKRVQWDFPKARFLLPKVFLLWLPFCLLICPVFFLALYLERQVEKGVAWVEKQASKSIDAGYYAAESQISLEHKTMSEKSIVNPSRLWNMGKIKVIRLTQRGMVESKTKLFGYLFWVIHLIMDFGNLVLIGSFLYLVTKSFLFVLAKSILWREGSNQDVGIVFRLP
jgi:hypothetical protein